ncbi:hypothetical protein EWM64_g7071 [Hericium alpestre]|uniref:CCHC-type domain-containing protein n=1 Tax=Hericium alpestre TaxID=135208 RepID=A0A4Y9ZSZ4_9AGAM|nr:hypothetical protein EWM64_g7071 [Hericium alpestre]
MQSTERVDKLKEGNYVQWRTVMEALLIAADLGVKAVQAREKKRQQARSKITLSIESSQMPFIVGLEDPRLMWKTLEDIHRSGSVNHILSLRRCFFSMTKLESESTMDWTSCVRSTALELFHSPVPVQDIDIILVITDDLPEEYQSIVTALDGIPFSDLTLSSVMSCISGLESQLSRSQDRCSVSDQALVARQTRFTGSSSKDVTCYTCGEKGHMARVCPSSQSHVRFAKADSVESNGEEFAQSAQVDEPFVRLI